MNFEFVAVSDIWNRRREEGAAYIEKLSGGKIDPVRNNDELYARNDIDAVLIATADFQHAQHGIEAVNAGRDAYVEKPTAHTMDDARNFRRRERPKRSSQVGTQRRSHPSYQKAYEYIKSGKFGDIVMVEMTWNVNQPGRWRRPDVVPLLKEEDTDWKRYLLNRPRSRSTPASILSSASSGRTPRAFPTSGSSTRSTPCTGSPACRIRAASSPTAASICGRTAARTGTP
jgi:predicted dehydrogenase